MVNRRKTHRRREGLAKRLFDIVLAAAILALLGLAVLRLDHVESRELAGAAAVSDGDSLLLAGQRLRLRGLDAPELDQNCSRDGAHYACGRQARDELRRLIGGREVACRGWELDRYGRLLVHCLAGDTDLNEAMVLSGWAVAYGDYHEAERQARQAALGLWSGDFETPSQWRAVHGGMAEEEHHFLRILSHWLKQIFRPDQKSATRATDGGVDEAL